MPDVIRTIENHYLDSLAESLRDAGPHSLLDAVEDPICNSNNNYRQSCEAERAK